MASPPQAPHVVLIPQFAQGHVTPMLNLAKLLHSRGFCVTFVNSNYNHRRLLKSRGPRSLDGLPDFRFEAIDDDLPPSDKEDVTQEVKEIVLATVRNSGAHFRDLLVRLNGSQSVPKVSCVIADGLMSCAQRVAAELGILSLVLWTASACGLMAYLQVAELARRGYTPLKDESYLTNGYLQTPVDWIPSMKDIRLKDFPSFIRTTDPNEILLDYHGKEAQNTLKAHGLILNTFDELELEVIDSLKTMFAHLYTIGPLSTFVNQIGESPSRSIGSNLWKEDTRCLDWLEGRKEASVVYVNFGSITVMTARQLEEFAWGLANSRQPFLWIIRPDIVAGEKAIVSEEFGRETRERGMLASWCPQEQVLSHPSIGVFLTHSGWNSTLESICCGVPMICWPFFSEQQTNCRYVCAKWEIGMEIDNDVRREDVEVMVRELMEGEKGKEMRLKTMNWKTKAEDAAKQGGTSYENVNKLVNYLQTGSTSVPN